MASGRRITWSSTDRYSPVQDRAGVVDPAPDELPPVHRRVRQDPSPYQPAWLDEREILRVTYQGDDRCQLRCPGCYTGARLDRPSIAPTAPGDRLRVPWDEFTGHTPHRPWIDAVKIVCKSCGAGSTAPSAPRWRPATSTR